MDAFKTALKNLEAAVASMYEIGEHNAPHDAVVASWAAAAKNITAARAAVIEAHSAAIFAAENRGFRAGFEAASNS